MRDAASAFASHGDAWLPYADKDGNVTGAASVSTIAIMCANGMRDAIVVNGKTGTFKGITRAARTS